MSHVAIILDWFSKKTGGSLYLPDGWFGRPYDNIHQISSINETKSGNIQLVLDENIFLYFVGLEKAQQDSRDLILGPFDTLFFEWKDPQNNSQMTKEYCSGEVRIISHPG
jgi:hypothetical protein